MRSFPLIVVATLLTASGAYAQSEEGPPTYNGCREASAAVRWNERFFIAANDEDNVLRIYDVKKEDPVHTIDLDKTLVSKKFKKKKHRKVDIEGATRIGGLSLWIGSHSRTSEKHKLRPARFSLFGVQTSAKTVGKIRFVGAYNKLLDDLIAADKRWGIGLERACGGTKKKDYEIGPKDPGGFNIEGLSVIGGSKGIYIGLRNPLYTKRKEAGEAIMIPVLNPIDLVTGKARRAKFGKPIFLDLGGLSIRGMEYSESHGCYFIIGGTYAAANDTPYKIFRWSGEAGSPARCIHTQGADEPNFTPESLLIYPSSEVFQLLSDEGRGSKKEKGKGSFRSRWIAIKSPSDESAER